MPTLTLLPATPPTQLAAAGTMRLPQPSRVEQECGQPGRLALEADVTQAILRTVASTTPVVGPSAPLTDSTGKPSPARELLGSGSAVDTQLGWIPTCKEGAPTCEEGWPNAQPEAVAGGLLRPPGDLINSNAYLGGRAHR